MGGVRFRKRGLRAWRALTKYAIILVNEKVIFDKICKFSREIHPRIKTKSCSNLLLVYKKLN